MSPADLSNKSDVSVAIVLASYAFEAYAPSVRCPQLMSVSITPIM